MSHIRIDLKITIVCEITGDQLRKSSELETIERNDLITSTDADLESSVLPRQD